MIIWGTFLFFVLIGSLISDKFSDVLSMLGDIQSELHEISERLKDMEDDASLPDEFGFRSHGSKHDA